MRVHASAMSVILLLATGARAADQIYSPPQSAPPAAPLAAPQPGDAPEAPPDVEYDPDQYDPNIYADSVDTDVTYDNSVAQGYDDGYDPQAYAQFADGLSPYGTWVDDSAYGRVWMPSIGIVGAGFSPYASGGHWALTEYGWTWISDWDWGWAPFHYGRWAVLGGRGWCWIPGTLWGPAWVSWRSGGGYVGWSPLPPRGVWVGRPIGASTPWRFTVASHLGATHPTYLSSRAVPAIFGRTSVVSNARVLSAGGATVRVNTGPARIVGGSGAVVTPARFASVAPRAVPRVAIQPRAGVAVAARPWVQAGVHQQAPVSRWPSTGAASFASRSPTVTNVRPMAPNIHAGLTMPGTRPPAWSGGSPAAAAQSYRPSPTAPVSRPAPQVRTYARPVQSYASPPARSYAPPPAQTYAPPPMRSYAPPPMRSYAPPAAVRSYAPPPVTTFRAPAPSFSAPPAAQSFSSPSHSSFSAGGGAAFRGGGSMRGRR